MKILIDSGSRSLSLRLPTGLVFSRLGAGVASLAVRNRAPDAVNTIPPEAVFALFEELRRAKRKYGEWELVDVVGSKGEHVKILL